MKLMIGLAVAAAMLGAIILQSEPVLGQGQVEVGQVTWNRDLEAAKALATKTGKPLFVQFQEVPG